MLRQEIIDSPYLESLGNHELVIEYSTQERICFNTDLNWDMKQL